MTTIYGGNQTNSAGNRSWKASLTYTATNSNTSVTISGVSIGAYLNTNASWTNVYFTNRVATFAGTNFINTSTQATVNWSAAGNKTITSVTTTKAVNRGCTASSGSISFSVKHKESAKTSSGSSTFSVPARTLYTISFNGNNGTVTSGAKVVCANCSANHKAYGYNTTISATATRTGYTFGGWNTAADGSGTSYANGATYSANASATLYAKWTEQTATLTYANGGHGTAPAAVTMKYTAATNAASAITATGYTFTGWKRSDTSAVIAAGTEVKAANVVPSALTLTAQWSANSYTATFNPNGGSLDSNGNWGSDAGTTNSHGCTVVYDSTNYAAQGKATKTGYTFKGWYTASSGGTQVYDANGSAVNGDYWNGSGSTATWKYAGSPTFYAQWTENAAQLTYNANGHGDAPLSRTMYYSKAQKVAPPMYAAGYNFIGWNTAANGSGTSYPPYSTLKAANVNPSATILYAQWQNAWYVKVNGTWKPFTTSYVKINGTWKSDRRIVAKDDLFLRAFVIIRGTTINAYYLPSVPMTWGEFIASNNNPGEFALGGGNVVTYDTSDWVGYVYDGTNTVYSSDLVNTDIAYSLV